MARIAEAVLLAVVVAVIAILFYDPGNTTEAFARETIPQTEVSSSLFDRRYEYFDSQGSKIEAWLYTPKNVHNPPIAILAHGIGMQKHHQLDRIAEAFAKKGVAALVFDYRHFGGSEGEPRNLVKVSKQISDWHAAIRHVGTLKGINGNKIGLWGTSFAGGHVLTVASEQLARKNPNITCVVSRAPYLDSLDSIMHMGVPLPSLLKNSVLALKDLILSFFGKHQYIPLLGDSSSLSVLTVQDANGAMKSLGAKDGSNGWHNLVPARTLLEIALYRPQLQASSITVPTLITYASNDELISAGQVEQTAATIPGKVTLEKFEATHFQMYGHEGVIETEANFLAKNLL